MNDLYSHSKCHRVASGFFGDQSPCNFEPRYDTTGATGIPPDVLMKIAEELDAVEIIHQFRTETYIGDVCTACGAMVKRPHNV